jgi:hypothetical protein
MKRIPSKPTEFTAAGSSFKMCNYYEYTLDQDVGGWTILKWIIER